MTITPDTTRKGLYRAIQPINEFGSVYGLGASLGDASEACLKRVRQQSCLHPRFIVSDRSRYKKCAVCSLVTARDAY